MDGFPQFNQLGVLSLLILIVLSFERLELRRDEHVEYLMRGLRALPASFSSLDAK